MSDHTGNHPFEALAEKQATYCRLFSHPKRILILWLLLQGEMSVGGIAEGVGTSLQNISQHLSLLKDFEIVSCRREGQTIYYRLEDHPYVQRCICVFNERMAMIGAEALPIQPNLKGK